MKQAQNNFRKDRLLKMRKNSKILFVYAIVAIMLFLLCGCQSKSKKNEDNTVKNNIEEETVSDEQVTEDDFDNDISENKQNNLNSDSEQSYFNDETSDDETDTQTSNSNTNNSTSKPSTNTENSKPSTNTQNTQSSTNTNNSGNNSTTNKTEQNNNTSTSTETPKPTETTPEQPKGTLIANNVYGYGNEHTKVVRGITFHWYDRYEQKYINKSIDFVSLDVRFEKETDPLYASKTNDKFCFDYEATASHETSVWLRMYDSEGYYLEEILLYNNTNHSIQGKSRGTMWCADIDMYIDATNEIYPAYVEIYPAL